MLTNIMWSSGVSVGREREEGVWCGQLRLRPYYSKSQVVYTYHVNTHTISAEAKPAFAALLVFWHLLSDALLNTAFSYLQAASVGFFWAVGCNFPGIYVGICTTASPWLYSPLPF